MLKKHILFFLSALVSLSIATAQTTDVGPPHSFLAKRSLPIPTLRVIDAPNVTELLAEDALNEANGIGPWRFGDPQEVNVDLLAEGTWSDVHGGGRICQMSFVSPNALTLNLLFYKFHLPKGATLHVYSSKTRIVDGAYTDRNNQPDKLLATIPLSGNHITVEYFEPQDFTGQSELLIGEVIYGYRAISDFYTQVKNEAKALNSSGACNYDVECSRQASSPFGSPGAWDEQIESVAMMMSNGSGFCSGALVNNTANDGTPYFLTANHCGTSNGGAITFLFGWESPTAICATNQNSSNGPTFKTINGATLRANRSGSDFALWEMNSTPPASYEVYYAGWDRSGNAPTEVTGIHHPRGDVKKICREEDVPYTSSAAGAQVWWIDDWEWGVTEPGSSGSPIFDQNKRIVGQLYGGLAACSGTSNNGSYDYYGRFDVSWAAGGSPSARLREWLDPLNTNTTVLDGYNPNSPTADFDAGIAGISSPSGSFCNETSFVPQVELRNYGIETLTSVTISYGLTGQPALTFEWNGNIPTGQIETVALPEFFPGATGVLGFTASTSQPNGFVDQNSSNDGAASNFQFFPEGREVLFSITLDCWGAESTWQIVEQVSGQVVSSGGPYSNGTGGTQQFASVCLGAGCYTFTLFDSFGDGLEGTAYSSCGLDGDYQLTDVASGEVLVQMGIADFGSEVSHDFCLEDVDQEVPCAAPYPAVTGLSSTILLNGVQLNWDPIPGSKGCIIQGGLASGGALQSFEVIADDLSSFFVPSSFLQLTNQDYRWRVRCGCSRTPAIVGPNSPFAFFFWGDDISGNNPYAAFLEVVDVFPNPVERALFIGLELYHAEQVDVFVHDLSGKVVYERAVSMSEGMNSIELDVSGVANGMYLLNIRAGDAIQSRKIVVQH